MPNVDIHRQATLHDFGLVDAELLAPQTEPATYLCHYDVPETEPTYIVDEDFPPTPIREHVPPVEAPGEQVPLAYFTDRTCPLCDDLHENVEKHLLVDHPEEVSAFISRRAEEIRERRERATPGHDDGLDPRGPVMYKQTGTRRGERLDPVDARACDGCGERVSWSYARVFGREDGTLYCANCKPRSQRYTNNPTYGLDHESDPSTVTGSSNPRSHANPHATWPSHPKPSEPS